MRNFFFRLWEPHKLRVSENGFLRNLFNSKREKMTENCRKLYHEEIYLLCSSLNIIMAIKSRKRWGRHVVRMGEERNSCRVLVDKPEVKKYFEDWV